MLEASAADIEFAHGRFVIAGTDRSVGIMELAERVRAGISSPAGRARPRSTCSHVSDGPAASTYPNGCHVCEVELDPETGVIEVVKYCSVNDFGTVINPLIVEGQLHGGVVQGIGQAVMEMTVYDDDGQFLTGSFMDYALPRANDAPEVTVVNHPVPATTNVLGRQGLRRGRLCRLAHLGHECDRRCALRVRHPALGHAGDALSRLACHPETRAA